MDLEVGWRFDLVEQFVLRVWLGGPFAAASATTVTPSWTPRRVLASAIGSLGTEAEVYLDETNTQYVHTATLGLILGRTF